jgi:hypothetical protein
MDALARNIGFLQFAVDRFEFSDVIAGWTLKRMDDGIWFVLHEC